MMWKKIYFSALALAGILAASTSVSATLLCWNELNDETYGASVGAAAFEEKVEELSGGSLEIDLYLNGALGSEQESLQGLQMGTLDIFRGNASSLGDYGAEIIGSTGLPYLFQSIEEFEQMAESPLGQEILNDVENADCGFLALAWLVEGPRNLFITEETYKELGSPDEITLDMLKNLNIRVPGSKLLTDTIEALGACPREVKYSDLRDALLSGNIDGAENGVISYISQGFSEAAPYYITDAHTFGCGVILISKATWDSLSDEEKGWMKEAGAAASEACYQYNLEEEEAYYEQFEANGITKLSVADIEAWQEACSGIYDAQSEAVQAVIQKIQERDY